MITLNHIHASDHHLWSSCSDTIRFHDNHQVQKPRIDFENLKKYIRIVHVVVTLSIYFHLCRTKVFSYTCFY